MEHLITGVISSLHTSTNFIERDSQT